MNLLWSSWRYESFTKRDKVLWDLSATTIFWGIWRERNNRIFNNSTRSSDQTFHACFTFISYWLNLLSDTSRELARQTGQIMEQMHTCQGSDSQSEETKDRKDDSDTYDIWSTTLQTPDFWHSGLAWILLHGPPIFWFREYLVFCILLLHSEFYFFVLSSTCVCIKT